MKQNKSILLIASLFVLNGCSYKSISHGREITQQEADTIKLGRTSKEDIMVMFGEPTKITSDGKTFFYSWTRGSKFDVMGVGSGAAEGKSLVIVFDEKNTVKNYRITRGATGGQQID
jgi:outer membrane protein assembly factor BamE (lipoprotein component of BamABCDE complex)